MDPILVNGRLEKVVYRYGLPAYGYMLASGAYIEKRCKEWHFVDPVTYAQGERVTVQTCGEAQAAAALAPPPAPLRLVAQARRLAQMMLWTSAGFAAAVVFCVGTFTVVGIAYEDLTHPASVPATRIADIRRKLDAQQLPGETREQVTARVIAALEDRIDREWARCVAERGTAACEQREAALFDDRDATHPQLPDAQWLRPVMEL